MPFVEQEEAYKDEIVEGKKVKVYKPRVEVTIKNLKTSREYLSDAEAQADVDSAVTDTCLLYTSPSPRDRTRSRMPSSA